MPHRRRARNRQQPHQAQRHRPQRAVRVEHGAACTGSAPSRQHGGYTKRDASFDPHSGSSATPEPAIRWCVGNLGMIRGFAPMSDWRRSSAGWVWESKVFAHLWGVGGYRDSECRLQASSSPTSRRRTARSGSGSAAASDLSRSQSSFEPSTKPIAVRRGSTTAAAAASTASIRQSPQRHTTSKLEPPTISNRPTTLTPRRHDALRRTQSLVEFDPSPEPGKQGNSVFDDRFP